MPLPLALLLPAIAKTVGGIAAFGALDFAVSDLIDRVAGAKSPEEVEAALGEVQEQMQTEYDKLVGEGVQPQAAEEQVTTRFAEQLAEAQDRGGAPLWVHLPATMLAGFGVGSLAARGIRKAASMAYRAGKGAPRGGRATQFLRDLGQRTEIDKVQKLRRQKNADRPTSFRRPAGSRSPDKSPSATPEPSTVATGRRETALEPMQPFPTTQVTRPTMATGAFSPVPGATSPFPAGGTRVTSRAGMGETVQTRRVNGPFRLQEQLDNLRVAGLTDDEIAAYRAAMGA